MGDVLSQNEIDNLLAALSTGELDVEPCFTVGRSASKCAFNITEQFALQKLLRNRETAKDPVASGESRLPSWTTRPRGVPSASALKNPPLTPATQGR